MIRSPSKQRGAAVMDAVFWSVIIVSGMTLRLVVDAETAIRDWGVEAGKELTVLNSGVASLLASDETLPDGGYTDWQFLRSVECGGLAAQHHVPCDFTVDSTKIGPLFSNIVIASVPSSTPGIDTRLATITVGPVRRRELEDPDPALAGIVASIANGAGGNQAADPLSDQVRIRSAVDIDQSTVQVALQTSAVAGTWLRSDGITPLRSNLRFSTDEGLANLDIRNVASVEGQRLIDWDDENFLIDPLGETRVREVDVTGTLTASSLIDSDDPAFLLDPSQISTLQRLDAGSVQINGRASEGAACPELGMIMASNQDELLLCGEAPDRPGEATWVRPGIPTPDNFVIAYEGASCPAGFTQFHEATGRVLVGKGTSADDNAGLEPYRIGDTAGVNEYELQGSQVRAHHMIIEGRFVYRGAYAYNSAMNNDIPWQTGLSNPIGEGAPVDNRMPGVALTLCRKTPADGILAGWDSPLASCTAFPPGCVGFGGVGGAIGGVGGFCHEGGTICDDGNGGTTFLPYDPQYDPNSPEYNP